MAIHFIKKLEIILSFKKNFLLLLVIVVDVIITISLYTVSMFKRISQFT
jgi:hypothetical protein